MVYDGGKEREREDRREIEGGGRVREREGMREGREVEGVRGGDERKE